MRTSLQEVTFAQLDKGRAHAALEEALADAARDIVERPQLFAKRKVILEITMTPDKRFKDDPVPQTDIECSVITKVPARQGGLTCAVFNDEGKMLINVMESENPNQMQIEDEIEKNVTNLSDARKVKQ